MIDITVLDNWITKKRDESVSIVLAGRVFGGRYGESPQKPKDYEYVKNTLTLKFGTTEILEIVEPESALVGSQHELIIPRAKSALWGWHYYGRKETQENWCTCTYAINITNMVHLTVKGPISSRIPANEIFLYNDDKFVLLI